MLKGILIFILGLIYGFGVGLIWFNIMLEKQFKKQPKVKSIEINLSELLKQMERRTNERFKRKKT